MNKAQTLAIRLLTPIAFTISISALAKDRHHSSTNRETRPTTSPVGTNKDPAVWPAKEGIWFVDEMPDTTSQPVSNIRKFQPDHSHQNGSGRPASSERYTIAEAEKRLQRATSQLAKDEATLKRLADKADPHKLELWRADIERRKKMITEKRQALDRIKTSYVKQNQIQRDSRLYEDQSKFYKHTRSEELDFK